MMSSGSGVQMIDDNSYIDSGSMKSSSNVQRVGGEAKDDIDTSMAGLTDYSMSSDVRKMNDSQGDLDFSMADIDEEGADKKP